MSFILQFSPVPAPFEPEEGFGDMGDLCPRPFPKDLLTGAEYKVEGQGCWYKTSCVWATFGEPACVMCALAASSMRDDLTGLGSPLLPPCLLFLGGSERTVYDTWMADKLTDFQELDGPGLQDRVQV